MSIVFVWCASAESQELIITSQPSAAIVYINENLAGTTPLVVPLEPGVYTVSLRKEGYVDHLQQIVFRGGRERIHFKLCVVGTPDYRIFDRSCILGLPTAYINRKGKVEVSFGTEVLELSVGLPVGMTLRLFNVGVGLRQWVLRGTSLELALDYRKKFIDLLLVTSLTNLNYAFYPFAGISNRKLDYGIVKEYAVTPTIKLLSGYRYRIGGWLVGVDFAVSKHLYTELFIDKNLKIYLQIGYKIN